MKFIKLLGSLFVVLIVIITVNTANFTSSKTVLKPLLDNSTLNKEALALRLSEAIQFKTISSNNDNKVNEQAFVDFHQFLAEEFPKLHQTLELEKVNNYSLLYHWKGTNPSLKPTLLISHLDVVPADGQTLDRWSHAPFSGDIENGIIWGRGAIDIKSGVVGMMEAVENLIGKGFAPKRSIYLAFGHDEEIGGLNGALQIADRLRNRNIEFEYILDEGGSIVSDGVIPGINSPVALIGIAEKGYLSLKLTKIAIGGHSSMPPKHSALGEVALAIVALENTPFPVKFQYSQQTFENILPAMAGIQKAIFANMWLSQPLVENILSQSKTANAAIRTTTAVTMAKGSDKDNVLPTEASAVVNFRLMPGDTVEQVIAYVTQAINNDSIKVSQFGSFGREASTVSKSDNQNFLLIKESIYRVTQDSAMIITPYLVVGGTDSKHYAGLSDSIYRFTFNRLTPSTLDRMHGIDEQIKVDDYIDMVKFYRELILGTEALI
ncbi:M20 family peptidase [Colwellia sp. 12G3]|uniref:M20 family peptidase n=1 Tax=Colwellia sp. 12G3 TaxID=2058299 RepID=UPI0012FF10CA|nr:M20 family peptidase [Colwellia sp. 12G3]